MARTLTSGQRTRVLIADVVAATVTEVFETNEVLLEAPNWALDGSALYLNGDGFLFRIRLGNRPALERIPIAGVPPLNNDHVLDPDGIHVFVSADDGHIYRAPLAGGKAVRITNDHRGRHHFLHGVSPDGATLAYVGVGVSDDGAWGVSNLYTIPADGGVDRQWTDDQFPDDGVEFSPDGKWLYFNSERGGGQPGHAQLFRMRVDESCTEQLTDDERVNWFPHLSPDGSQLAYVSFPPGTLGHPADLDVLVRVCRADGAEVRDVRWLRGGQGTMNVNSWSPDSTRIAFTEYPVG